MAVWSIVKLSELGPHKRLDAEYYHPKYRINFSDRLWLPIGEITSLCQYGISQQMNEDRIGYPIFRMDDIRNSFLADDEVKFVQVPSNIFHKYKLEPDDIVFNRVKTEDFVGRTGIFKLSGEYVFASYLVRLRVNPDSQFLPDYLNIFLNSSFGTKQIRRLSRRAVNQANVNAQELKSIKIPIVSLTFQKHIKELSNESFSQFQNAKLLYIQAEQLLLQELDWDKLDLSQPKSWTVPLSIARDANRLDAEHFQPKYDKLMAHLQNTKKAKRLSDIAHFVKRGLQPTYVSDGDVIVVNSQHLGRYLLNVEATERTDKSFWKDNKRAQLQKNDVLLYSTGAYVGRTNVWLENSDGMASNHVTIIRPKDSCNPLYLAVFLNSPPGLLQTEKWASGSGQREIYPGNIQRFLVHVPSADTQQRVADLVQQSYEARQKAKLLLEKAKQSVEVAIEKGEEEAMTFFNA